MVEAHNHRTDEVAGLDAAVAAKLAAFATAQSLAVISTSPAGDITITSYGA